MKSRRVKSFEYDMVRLGMLSTIWWQGVKLYKNPITSAKVTRLMIQRFTKLMGKKKLVRGFKVDGKYHWDMFNPAWPSPGFNAFFRAHLLEERQTKVEQATLRRLIIAITKRCPLQCEHCSEAATLYKQDVLTLDEMIVKIDPIVERGVGQLVFSGGEPIARLNDLLALLNRYKSKCDQWIYTSGFGLTLDVAKKLKAAGLHGAAISLDHYSEEKHNAFRGSKRSFQWVIDAIKNLQQVGILVSINACPTRELVESGGVEELIKVAKDNNVPIVNLLEPRAVGNYEGKDIEYDQFHKDALMDLVNKYNFDKSLFEYPTVLFPAGYRGKVPCGGGLSYIFMDYDGQFYPCPFCKTKMSKVESQENLCAAS